MSRNYSVRLGDGSVLGPYSNEELEKLYRSGKIDLKDEYKDTQDGGWIPLSELFGMDLKGKMKEFPFDPSKHTIDVDYEQLQKKYEEKENEAFHAKTVIKRDVRDLGNLEKTIIVDSPEPNPEEEEPKEQETITDRAEPEVEAQAVDRENATMVIEGKDILINARQESLETEEEIKKLEEMALESETASDKAVSEDKDKEEKRKKFIRVASLSIAVIVLYFFLFDEGTEERKTTIRPSKISITFPLQNEYIDEKLSEKAMIEGMQLYQKGTYLAKALAVIKFRESLKHKFDDNPSLGYLTLAYAELLPNASNSAKATIVLNNLVRITESKALSEVNVATARALYYLNSEKPFTAILAVERFIRFKKQPTKKLFAIYLTALTRVGNFEQAKKVYDKLRRDQKGLTIEVIAALAEYLETNQNYEESAKIVADGLKKYPSSVFLLLKAADHAFRKAEIKPYRELLDKIKALGYESCPEFYAKYLEHQGILSAMGGDTAQATTFFRMALNEHETVELRSKLATLELSGNEAAQKLILESKIIDEMRRAKKFKKEYQWNQAFTHAINAVDMNRSYIPSHILLSDIQIERGYFKSAIETLKKLQESHPKELSISLKLIDAYIESYRYNDAFVGFNALAQNTIASESGEYAALLAKYFTKKRLFRLAVSWYKKAVKKYPLRDEYYFQMAEIYRKGNNFNAAKKYLLEALSLNPEEASYKVLYSQIRAEEDGYDVAIGYLRKELEEARDKTVLLGEIAANYYRNGELKYFEDTLKEVEKMDIKDESFYRFLMRASKLNGQKKESIAYAKELLKIKPGAMDVMILLAEDLLEGGDFDGAIGYLREVKERMSNYPQVNYYLSKVYYLKGELNTAMAFADEEIKTNPASAFGFVMQGKVLMKEARFMKAIKSFERALMIDHRNIDSLIDLAAIRQRQNKFEQARELLLRALRIEKNRPEIYRQLGYVYRGIGQSSLALESLNTYLQLAPAAKDSPQVKQVIDLLK